MNKYKLINKQTGESHLCDKIEIDGFDYYYLSNVKVIERFDGYLIDDEHLIRSGLSCDKSIVSFNGNKIIATTNPNIDCPKVVNDVEIIFKDYEKELLELGYETQIVYSRIGGCIHGYNKSQETHPNSDEDVIEFNEWCIKEAEWYTELNKWMYGAYSFLTTKELLQLWKEQQPKTIYYE